MNDLFLNILLLFVGSFALAGALFDWNWFMESRKARQLRWLLRSRRNVRIFYGIFGVGIIIFSFIKTLMGLL